MDCIQELTKDPGLQVECNLLCRRANMCMIIIKIIPAEGEGKLKVVCWNPLLPVLGDLGEHSETTQDQCNFSDWDDKIS